MSTSGILARPHVRRGEALYAIRNKAFAVRFRLERMFRSGQFPIIPTLPAANTGDSLASVSPETMADLRLRSDRRLAAVAMVMVALPSLWFVTADLALYQGNLAFLGARFMVRLFLVGVPLVGVALLQRCKQREPYRRTVFVVSLGLALAFVAINAVRPSGSGLPIGSPLFVIAVMYAALPNTFWKQAIPPLMLSAGVIGVDLAWLLAPGGRFVPDVVVFASLNAVGLLVVRRRIELEAGIDEAWENEQAARRAAERALAELHALRGIIPICSHCKCVRTEQGDWQQIEQYVREHSAAEFSHGICPDCLQVYYREELDEELLRAAKQRQ